MKLPMRKNDASNTTMGFEIREEQANDVTAIHQLNTLAFETDAEATLVDTLRKHRAITLSLVAIASGEIVGHIAFSPVVIDSGTRSTTGVGLAPVAVASSHQRQGIGTALITEGLRRLRHAGHKLCVVLGHAKYYPKHGFVQASKYSIRWERPVPENVFFVQALTEGALDGVSGVVRYRPEFDSV